MINPRPVVLNMLASVYGKPVSWFYDDSTLEVDDSLNLEPEEPSEVQDPQYEDDIAFIERQPNLFFRGLQGDLTPEEAREVRQFIEWVLARRQMGGD